MSHDDDLDLLHVLRVVVLQTVQLAVGTAIGLGVLLLVGILGVLLSPILVPGYLLYRRRQRRALQAPNDAGASAIPPDGPTGVETEAPLGFGP